MGQFIHAQNFKSHLFIKLFSSYVAIILSVFVLFFCGVIHMTSDLHRERQNQYYGIMVHELGRALDVQLEEANVILSSIKASESFRDFNTNPLNTNSMVTPARMIEQIRNDIFSTNNLNIYDAVLWLQGSQNIYTSTQVYKVDHYFTEEDIKKPSLQLSSLSKIYDFQSSQTLFSKQWLVYSQECSNVFSNGIVSILLDRKTIREQMLQILAEDNNITFEINGIDMCSKGTVENADTYMMTSVVDPSIYYTLNVDASNFKNGVNIYMIAAIAIAFIVVIIYVILSLLLANNYYEPIETIEKIIDEAVPGEENVNEFANITTGISQLIGERNGYREKMISIKPYAQQGVIHGLMNGNIEEEHVNILMEEDYMVLHRPYFMLGVMNIAYAGEGYQEKDNLKKIKWSLQEIVSSMSNEEMKIVLYDKDKTDIFIIVNSNKSDDIEPAFYTIHSKVSEAAKDKGFLITIGVDQLREDISQISESCNNAVKMLGNIAVGGRDTVYFYQNETMQDRHKYYFPNDAVNRLTLALREQDTGFIKKYLEDILKTNVKKYDISPDTAELLVDELHVTTIKVIKNVNQSDNIDFSIEKMKRETTLEEMFEYYFAIYQTVCGQLLKLEENRQEIADLNQSILDCIDEKCFDSMMSLQFLTEKFGVSNKYISIMCKKYLGMTYLQYVQEKRILKAAELMRTTELSLEQIANQTGYVSMLTFRRNFKAVMGVNPSEYSAADGNK
ncbi:MAG: helix-turn-helix transcriptional regulator [Eubacteriales bacterium]|nr:helix-turn-helix transcriptional regulator [Eubacteriales bacterium]